MGTLRSTALLLLLLAGLLRGCGSSVHSMRNFLTAVSEPGQGLPSFVAVNYVDGQCFERYDSNTRREMPAAPWMEKVTEDHPNYWDRETDKLRVWEAVFRVDLSTLRERYNQSAGLHTLQHMDGCDLNEDLPSGGHFQYGYEGRDFLAFDKETLTWTATDAAALITKRRWEAEPALAQRWKNYLEEGCIEWLRKYLRYGNQTLLRKEPPVVKVTRKDSQDGLETLLCRAHGFYPKEIDITWRKDGEVMQGDTFHGVVSPNDDGTYYTWLSIDIDPQERSQYRCHVEHDGLPKSLDVAVERSVPVWAIALGVVSAAVLLVLVVIGVIYAIRNCSGAGYKARPGSVEGSDSSVTGGLLQVTEKGVDTPHQSHAVNITC